MAPAVVLVDGFGAALVFAVKGIGVEEPAGANNASASVVVPDDFGKDEFAGLRGIDGVRHGEIAGAGLRADASGGSVERRGGRAGDVVQEEAEVAVGGAPTYGEPEVAGSCGTSGVESLRDVVAGLDFCGASSDPGIAVVVRDS